MKIDKLFSFFAPKEGKFFPIFKQSSNNLITASELLIEQMNQPLGANREELAKKIKEVESKGDALTKDLLKMLNSTFITPFDREDIYDLASKTDLVVDLIFGASKKIQLYSVEEIPQELKEMAKCIHEAAIEIDIAFNGLKDVLDLSKYKDNCQKVRDIESKADSINYNYLAKLFHEEKDAIELIKRKDILQTLEKAVDCADDVSDILSSIIVKIA